jgi:hypothetical protein
MAAQDVVQKHAPLFDAARDGRLFHAATAATGVAPGTAIGTTAAFSLHNPFGSGIIIAIVKAALGYISGTLGAGTVWHLINDDPLAAAPTGTAIGEEAGSVTGANPLGVALTTVTLAAAPKIIRPFCSLGASLASSAVQPWQVNEDVGGGIILPAGCTYSLHATAAAGTAPLVAFGVTWEEVAVDAD